MQKLIFLLLVLIISGCSRQSSSEKSTFTLDLSSLQKQKTYSTLNNNETPLPALLTLSRPDGSNPVALSINPQVPYQAEWDRGQTITIQVLVFFPSQLTDGMDAFYAKQNILLDQAEQNIQISLTQVNGFVKGEVGGRYLTTNISGPTGKISYKLHTQAGLPPFHLNFFNDYMINGWFQAFAIYAPQFLGIEYSLTNGTPLFGTGVPKNLENFYEENLTTLGLGFAHVSANYNTTCAVKSNGQLFCWGSNMYGQVGDGTIISKTQPVSIDPGTSYSQVSTGQFHSCGLTTDQKIKCWGQNFYGQLGNNSTTESLVPVLVNSAANYTQVSVGNEFTCALKTDGAIHCWGRNDSGQLGNGTTTQSSIPGVISDGSTYIKIQAGGYHACGLINNNNLKCWGLNSYGNLGDGTQVNRESPTLIDSSTLYSQVSLGQEHTCGITQSGQLKCWGSNIYGMVGNNSMTNQITPLVIDAGTLYSQIHAGTLDSCAKTQSGQWKCWGHNSNNFLGINSNYDPIRTPTSVNFLGTPSFSLGQSHFCYLSQQSELICKGQNYEGQLGTGSGFQAQIALPPTTEIRYVYLNGVPTYKHEGSRPAESYILGFWGPGKTSQHQTYSNISSLNSQYRFNSHLTDTSPSHELSNWTTELLSRQPALASQPLNQISTLNPHPNQANDYVGTSGYYLREGGQGLSIPSNSSLDLTLYLSQEAASNSFNDYFTGFRGVFQVSNYPFTMNRYREPEFKKIKLLPGIQLAQVIAYVSQTQNDDNGREEDFLTCQQLAQGHPEYLFSSSSQNGNISIQTNFIEFNQFPTFKKLALCVNLAGNSLILDKPIIFKRHELPDLCYQAYSSGVICDNNSISLGNRTDNTSNSNYKYYTTPPSLENVLPWGPTLTTNANFTEGPLNQTAIQNSGQNHSASDYCRTLNWGGYQDWFLPSSDEWASFTYNFGNNPSAFGLSSPASYWTSREVTDSQVYVIAIDGGGTSFNNSQTLDKSQNLRVRCMRRELSQ